ncbi:MAG: response regulator [Terriglobales bacterium]
MARRILLADDSVTAQNMGRRILADAGYEVVTVNNGSAALKKIAENKPDIIVLDVYMPGYGGLEVCQRVKQSPDTARTPVLLTVGKLEPFKPEEARRVGADAFIIKPFEATELLTALTKLEDKIVAAPQPQKSGRFAKALAAVEQSAGERFGDKETGWKNRLTIPGPNARPSEAEAPETFAGPARDFDRTETAKPAETRPEFERPIPAGLPPDITPEEIAAITAAAAAFDGKPAHPTVIPEGSASESVAAMQAASAEISAVQSTPPEPAAATLASATELEPADPAEFAAEPAPVVAEVVSEPVASSATVPVEEPAATTESPAVETETPWVPPALAASQIREAEKSSSGDDEVMAAIASLAPSNGNGNESASPASAASQEVPVAVASTVAAEAGVTGPRWIAEAVAVTIEESAPTLEQEMELASQARIAAEAARNEPATASAVEVHAADTVVEAVAAQVVAEASAPDVGAVETVVTAEAVATPNVIEPNVIEQSGVEQKPVEEHPAAESAVPENIVAASVASENTTVESSPVQSLPVQSSDPETKEESAFAAAAAAGSGSERAPAVEAVSSTTISPEITESVPVASAEAAPQRESELAAAWQNWKQIRESFVSAQPAAPVAEAPAETKPVQEEAVEPAEPAEEEEISEVEVSASDAPGESTAIASIVDTMLAELRPKLVEEIAKKMKSEKKDKEKDKEKEKKKRR